MADTHSLDLERNLSQYASITDANQTGLDITGDITVEVWIKPESVPGGTSATHTILSKYVTESHSYIFAIYTNGSGTLGSYMFLSDVDAGGEFLFKAYTFSAATWYHIAWAWVAATSTCTFYVNGASIGTAVGTKTSINNGSAPFSLGTFENGAEGWDGLLDEVRVWNDIRTPTEISDNYKKELVGTESGLAGYWRLNNNYTDETSNNNTLTPSGLPVFSTDIPSQITTTSTSTTTTSTSTSTTQSTTTTSTSITTTSTTTTSTSTTTTSTSTTTTSTSITTTSTTTTIDYRFTVEKVK